MNYAQRLRALADRTGLDGFGDELRAMASEMEAASGEVVIAITPEKPVQIGPRMTWHGDTVTAAQPASPADMAVYNQIASGYPGASMPAPKRECDECSITHDPGMCEQAAQPVVEPVLAALRETQEVLGVTQCPWCGYWGQGYADSERPPDHCYHEYHLKPWRMFATTNLRDTPSQAGRGQWLHPDPAPKPVAVPAGSDAVFDLICNAIDKADTISMEGDYMLDSDDCIAVIRVMQALLSAAPKPATPQPVAVPDGKPLGYLPQWAVDRLTGEMGAVADPVTWGLHAPIMSGDCPHHVAIYKAPQPTPLPEHADHVAEIAARLRLVANLAGCPDAVPQDDEIAVGAIFSVLGNMRFKLERLPKPAPTTEAARDVLAERQRQIDAEGWTPEHDDVHEIAELAYAAACYALADLEVFTDTPPAFWPWATEWWKPRDRRRNLIKAGALILAEIERIDRAAKKGGQL